VAATGQYYNLSFRNLNSNDGIAQSEVFCTYEDRDGFLWIGTGYGLTVYDGIEFRSFYHKVNDPTSISGNNVTDIAQDKKGSLWFSTFNGGISRMDPLTKKFENFLPDSRKNSIVSRKVNTLLIDHTDKVWAGSSEGVSVYDPESHRFTNISKVPGTNEVLSVLCIESDRTGRVWMGASDKIFHSHGQPDGIHEVKTNIRLNSVNSLQFDINNQGWMATDEGIFTFEFAGADSIVLARPSYYQSTVPVRDIEFDGKGNLWIATRTQGLGIYFPKTGFLDQLKEDYGSSRGLLSNRIFDLYYDNSGGMWVSSENGVQSFHDAAQKFNIYSGLSNISERVRGSTIYGIDVHGDEIFLATSGGIIGYNRVTRSYLPIVSRHELDNSTVRFRSIRKEGKDRWWICSDRGLFELRREKDLLVLCRPPSVMDKDLLTASLRNYIIDGNNYWFAAVKDGLIRYDFARNEKEWFRHDPDDAGSLPREDINKIAFDQNRNVMVGHDNGLSVLYKGSKRFENYLFGEGKGRGLSNRYVYDMWDDGENIWIATFGGGINLLNKDTRQISYLTSASGLCNDAIYTLTPYTDSLLWLGTNKGLSVLNTRNRTFRNYQKNDGMPSEEFNMLSAFVDDRGEMYMGTVGGVISFMPGEVGRNLLVPGVYLSRIRKNGSYLSDSSTTVINRERKIIAKYGEDLFLEFSPMTFYGVTEPVLTYRIRETGDQWLNGEAEGLLPLIKVEPGSYTIDVKMKSYSGSESSKIWTLYLTVLPPFWKTTWFRVLTTLASLVLMVLLIRAYIRRRLERQRVEFLRQQAVEQERSRISAELHDDIGGGLTAIRLLSEMGLESDAHLQVHKYLQKISYSSNELIQKMNEIVWALNINNDNLQSLIAYTRQYAVSYLDDLNIACHFQTPDDIPNIPVNGKNRRSIFLLVKESLNNVVKHADADNVEIRVEIDGALFIEIADNGKGFDGTNQRGNGLNNMRKRIQTLRGVMDIRNGQGTTMVFEIPVRNLNV